MKESIVVLAVLHSLQGENFRGYDGSDSGYRRLIEGLIFSEAVDFVFEEASGYGPTIAEKVAGSKLKPGRYLDIDPPEGVRPVYGIPEKTSCPCYGLPCGVEEYVDVHEARETFWLRKLQSEYFDYGLVICGMLHGLSFASRLLASKDFGSVRLIIYPESLRPLSQPPHLDQKIRPRRLGGWRS